MGKVTGSIPVLGKFFRPKKPLFLVARLVGYLRANARVPPVYLPRVRLEPGFFILKKLYFSMRQGLKTDYREPGLQEKARKALWAYQLARPKARLIPQGFNRQGFYRKASLYWANLKPPVKVAF